MSTAIQLTGWERVAMAVEQVRDRLKRAANALESGSIPYAVIGGNAVAEWVGRVDQAAVRFTQDVDILLRRADLPAAVTAMQQAGFIHRHAGGIDFFLDGPGAKFRDAVHVLFAGEKVREEYLLPAADVDETESAGPFRVLTLDAVVRMKLTSFRRKDQVHLLDMLSIGLIDSTTKDLLIPELAARLQQLIDDPDG
ncbi:MAG: nucleotidyltransferase family protein [Planctomycetota bacterium]|nr:nucleotidyltransferase family protein [Planctomycetota bacterium]